MKDRIHHYLKDVGGEASTEDLLQRCAGVVGGAGSVGEALLGWIVRDPRFERTPGGLRLAADHDDPDRLALEDASFVVVDLETTGTRSRDSITEIGAVRVRDGLLEESWSTLVDPGERIPQRITRLTGIDDALVRGQPGIGEALPVFLSFLRGDVLVAHNAPFDLRFLRRARMGLQGLDLSNRCLCSVRLARRLLPRLRSRNLDALTDHFGIEVNGRHRALGDAVATARCLLRLLELARAAGDRTVGDLARYGGVPTAKRS